MKIASTAEGACSSRHVSETRDLAEWRMTSVLRLFLYAEKQRREVFDKSAAAWDQEIALDETVRPCDIVHSLTTRKVLCCAAG